MSSLEASGDLQLREAQADDAATLAELSTLLGYPTSVEQLGRRLEALIARNRAGNPAQERVIVAVEGDGAPLAWASCRRVEPIHEDAYLEVSGFVVDEAARGRGVGRLLMAGVRSWAESLGVGSVRLSANVNRSGAHRFYAALGFQEVKRQLSLRLTFDHPA